MSRALALAAFILSAASGAWGFDEAAIADRNLPAILLQLETGDWNARIHAVHELDYMQEEGLEGLALATEDGDWQVRMTAVHSLGGRGAEGARILNKLLKHEPCPVVRLMTLHSLGSLGPEGEEAKAMGWISDASNKDIACVDQPGPGRAAWARGTRPARKAPAAVAPERGREEAPAVVPAPAPGPDPVTPAPVTPPVTPVAKRARPKESLPAPTKFQRRIELDSLLETSTAAIPRQGVVLAMGSRSTASPEALPWPVAPVAREHEVSAPGVIMKDAGGKAAFDALPGLMRALKQGDVRTRARAADDLGHLGAKAAPAVSALMRALGDRSARVRASASLALGNIGAAHESVVPLLTKALKDRSEDVRYAAALALSRIDTPEARDAFNRHVGKEARRAIDRPKARDKAGAR
jgi:hypothetical protein